MTPPAPAHADAPLPGAPFVAYRDGRLMLEDVALAELAQRHGTPLFVYSKAAILSALAAQGAVQVSVIAQELGVSDMTIRRDLTNLASQGLLIRTHGGAIPPILAQPPADNAAHVSVPRHLSAVFRAVRYS